MKKNILAFFVSVIVLHCIAGTPPSNRKRMSSEQRKALLERIAIRRAGGGIVRMENSAKGSFAILNAQTKITEKEIFPVLEYIDKTLAVKTMMHNTTKVTTTNISTKIKEIGATLSVALIEDETLPTLLIAPETGWAIINILKVNEKCSNSRILASRVRKEILRSLAFITGCAYTTITDPLMRDVTKPSDIDALKSEMFSIEIINKFTMTAALYGLKPWYQATYQKACEEGWAPAPTNDVQKKIWNRIHATPKNPMKIEFDPKKGR